MSHTDQNAKKGSKNVVTLYIFYLLSNFAQPKDSLTFLMLKMRRNGQVKQKKVLCSKFC